MKILNKRYIVILVLFFVFSGLFFRYAGRAPKRHYCDFRVYYATAERFAAGGNIYSRPDESITPYKYSPIFAMLMAPLSFFSIKGASLIFFSLNFVLLALSFYLSQRLIIGEKIPDWKKYILYGMTIACTIRFILQVLDTGQVNIIMFFFVLLALYFLREKRDIPAAACIAFSIMFKYMPAVFLPYFIFRKKIKFVASTFIFVLIYCFIPALYAGFKANAALLKGWIPFIINTSMDNSSFYDFKNQSVFSFVLRFFTAGSPYGPSLGILSFNQAMIAGVVICALIYVCIIIPGRGLETGNPAEYSLLFLCMAIFNPNAWMMSFVVCVFVYTALLYYLMKTGIKDSITLILVVISFLLLIGGSESFVGNDIENLLEELSALTIGAFMLIFALLRLKFSKSLRYF